MHLSLIIPAYNEESRIAQTLREALAYLVTQPYRSEIIVVDDGSTDQTLREVQSIKSPSSVPLRAVSLPENRGKGFAVRTGMLEHAQGCFRVFFDADASTPIEELAKLWSPFDTGAGVVIGSRALPDSQIEVRQALYRQTMGRAFNLLLRLVRLTRFRDTQCGFKGFTAQACEIVFPRQTIDRFGFDAELLHIAQKHNLRIEEVPIRWQNRPQSRVHPLRDSAKMIGDLITVRWQDWRGLYD